MISHQTLLRARADPDDTHAATRRLGMPADGAIPLPVQPVGIMPDSPWLTAVGGGIY